ncbi:leucine-rich repeat-containing protein 23-like [Diorhabda carinulata]|uniref:leucine-rich repeat-containing protein 23-like n=1 Tax=Diorhabda carinulata TaxID=1163345 RepID=UPI0025A2C845|nr:leucine-rich repeat-containing protein 23-like [Diorhabda carinulata]
MEEELPGEGSFIPRKWEEPLQFLIDQIVDLKLTFEEASRSLNTLGKDESAVRYAYLMLTATDRKLTDISVIVNFSHLQFVDLSGNYLTLEALQVLSQLPYLLYIRAERNRIESAGLNPMHFLQVLIFNKNSIRETGEICQPILETLELADNFIYTVQFDAERLENLKELVLSGNHLLDTSGTYPKNLEKLFMGKNKIIRINSDLVQLKKLKYLHLRDNNIRKLTGFSETLENLTYLNLRSNNINKVRQLRKLNCLPKLETLIVLDNPFYKRDMKRKEEEDAGEDKTTDYTDTTTEVTDKTEYYGEGGPPPAPPVDVLRVRILALLPNLKRLNKDFVTLDEQEVVESTRQSLLDEIFEEESSEDDTDVATTTSYTTDFTTETDFGEQVLEQEEQIDLKTVEFADM